MLHEIDFANFADDTTPYVEGASANEVIKKLEQNFIRSFQMVRIEPNES